MNWSSLLFAVAIGSSAAANAGSSTLDAAIGGGIGGGGREGAIAGSALGAAVGTALNTDAQPRRRSSDTRRHYDEPRSNGHPHHRFCPPGQAKKGRC